MAPRDEVLPRSFIPSKSLLLLLILSLAHKSSQGGRHETPEELARARGGAKTTSLGGAPSGGPSPLSAPSRRRVPGQPQDPSQTSDPIKSQLNYLPTGSPARVSTPSPGQPEGDLSVEEEAKNLISRLSFPSSKSTMYFCSHPPNEFSEHYLGDEITMNFGSECSLSNLHKLVLQPKGAHELCAYIYFFLYGVELVAGTIERDGKLLWFYYEEDTVRLCLPLFERFDSCGFHDIYTKCGNVIFIHTNACPLLLSENRYAAKHVFEYIYSNKKECLKMLCEGTYFLSKSEIQGLTFTISCMLGTDEGEFCAVYHNTEINYFYNNQHWPCCYSYHTVGWYDNPEKFGLNGAWSFLPPWCRAAEIGLIFMVSCVAVGSSVGNLLVVMVMIRLWHSNEESNMLRLNLALADLFTSLFTVWPSLYHHIKPFIEPTNLQENLLRARVHLYSQEGRHLLQGIVFSSCTVVSLLTLFLLSFDRFVRTGRGLVYNHYITPRAVKSAIVFTWIVGISDALFMTYFMQEMGNVQWIPMLKLPIGSSIYYTEEALFITGDIVQKLTMAISIPCTITFSILSIVNFLREQMRVSAERQTLGIQILGPLRQENRHILITQLLMTISFLLATIPVGVDYVIDNMQYNLFPEGKAFAGCKNTMLITYISWWLFLASTAWNPFIYNMQSAQFRADLKETLQRFVPQRVGAVFKRHDENINQILVRRRRLLSLVGITDDLVDSAVM